MHHAQAAANPVAQSWPARQPAGPDAEVRWRCFRPPQHHRGGAECLPDRFGRQERWHRSTGPPLRLRRENRPKTFPDRPVFRHGRRDISRLDGTLILLLPTRHPQNEENSLCIVILDEREGNQSAVRSHLLDTGYEHGRGHSAGSSVRRSRASDTPRLPIMSGRRTLGRSRAGLNDRCGPRKCEPTKSRAALSRTTAPSEMIREAGQPRTAAGSSQCRKGCSLTVRWAGMGRSSFWRSAVLELRSARRWSAIS